MQTIAEFPRVFVLYRIFAKNIDYGNLQLFFQSINKKINPVCQDTDGELSHPGLQCYKDTAILRGSADCTLF